MLTDTPCNDFLRELIARESSIVIEWDDLRLEDFP